MVSAICIGMSDEEAMAGTKKEETTGEKGRQLLRVCLGLQYSRAHAGLLIQTGAGPTLVVRAGTVL